MVLGWFVMVNGLGWYWAGFGDKWRLGWYKARFVVVCVFSGGNRVFWVVSRRFGVIFGRFGVFPRTHFQQVSHNQEN